MVGAAPGPGPGRRDRLALSANLQGSKVSLRLPRKQAAKALSLARPVVVRILALLILVPALAVSATALAQEPAPPTTGEALFVLSGRGWGHGVGMSQWGAYGQANAGRSYDQILAHYYTGTELGSTGRKDVRVLLAEGRQAVIVSSAVDFSAVDARGTVYEIPAGTLALRAGLTFKSADPKVEGKVRKVKAVPPLLLRSGKAAPLALDGAQYRGKLELAAQSGFLRVVNVLPLELYLQGVVANEMPHTWPLEALKVQAVAARSYALANLVKGKPFDLYADVRSQVYRGVAGEKPRASEAVRATTREVVMYAGRIATTYYSSTSGGRTASALDVFGTDVPYLVSKPDPWDASSPYHVWGPILLGARTLQSKLGLGARVVDAAGEATPSGRLRSFTVQTTTGATKMPAALLRTSLGLRSTWVTIGVLRLDQPSAPVVYGAGVRVSGVARGLPSPVLSSSQSGATWTPVGSLQRQTSGVASLVVKPERTLRYRIEVKGAASPPILVRVAPRVQLDQPLDLTGLSGTVRPRLAGAAVTVERRRGSGWREVARATVDRSGSFRADFAVVAGSYRARVAATDLFSEGVAPVLAVAG
jgi:SpoIID/LytB domain protein